MEAAVKPKRPEERAPVPGIRERKRYNCARLLTSATTAPHARIQEGVRTPCRQQRRLHAALFMCQAFQQAAHECRGARQRSANLAHPRRCAVPYRVKEGEWSRSACGSTA